MQPLTHKFVVYQMCKYLAYSVASFILFIWKIIQSRRGDHFVWTKGAPFVLYAVIIKMNTYVWCHPGIHIKTIPYRTGI